MSKPMLILPDENRNIILNAIIATLRFWGDLWNGYHNLYLYVKVATGLKITDRQLRKFMKELVAFGLVDRSATFDPDTWKISGSGYFFDYSLPKVAYPDCYDEDMIEKYYDILVENYRYQIRK